MRRERGVRFFILKTAVHLSTMKYETMTYVTFVFILDIITGRCGYSAHCVSLFPVLGTVANIGLRPNSFINSVCISIY